MHLKDIIYSWSALTWVASAINAAPQPSTSWWKEGVTYQVYPASYKDSNGDGWGDIKGIISKLDHIKDLGVDIIWISPFYESPMVDMGYDISNYTKVDPRFGTNDDVKELLDEVHKRDMKCLFDLVINHSSDQHPWFQKSKHNKNSKEHRYYFWGGEQTLPNGTRYPPNNWGSEGKSMWTWDEEAQEYFFHVFTDKQPDLNWTNPDTRQVLYDEAMRYWLDMGADGFRMDAFIFYSKTPGMPDKPANDTKFQDAYSDYHLGPHIHDYLQEMNREVLSQYDCFTVGEFGASTNQTELLEFVEPKRKEINTVFVNTVTDVGREGYNPKNWTFKDWRATFALAQSLVGAGGWPTSFLENHDTPRSVSTFADDSKEWRVASGKLLSLLLTTMSGSLFMLQGQELGMVNVPKDWPLDNFRDSFGFDYLNDEKKDGGNITQAVKNLHTFGRDNARTPFNWDDGDGFSTNETTWLPQVHRDINLKDQQHDPGSVFEFWKEAIKFRKQNKDYFIYGDFQYEEDESEKFMAYTKHAGNKKALVLLNFDKQKRTPTVDIPKHARFAFGTHKTQRGKMEPFEGRVYFV